MQATENTFQRHFNKATNQMQTLYRKTWTRNTHTQTGTLDTPNKMWNMHRLVFECPSRTPWDANVCVCASFVFPFFHRLLFRDFNYNFVSFQWNRFQLWLWPVEWGGVGSFAKMTWEKAAPLHTGNPTKQLHGVCLLLRICRDIVPKRNLRGERRVERNAAIIIHYLETIQLLWRSN